MMMELRQRSKDEEAERRKVNYTNKIHFLIVWIYQKNSPDIFLTLKYFIIP